jgi:5-methylcytosine-specific restriction protein A
VGAAHGFQKGKPLRPKDFSGGKHTVQPKLERLGFSVVAMAIDDSTSAFPNEVPNNFWEGARLTITVNRFERSAKARLACIGHHGTKCSICSFDFGDVYGEEFAGFIHVHHIKPRNQINRRYEIDFIKDLVPVCPNCHAAIHYGNRHRSVVTIQKIFRRQKMKM